MTQVSPRKLPVQRRSAATVDCILEAAAHILEEKGLAGLSTNAVARRAGTSIGSLYQYFPGRDAITSALILRAHETIVAGMTNFLAATEHLAADAAIAALIEMLLQTAPRSPRLNRILEAEEDRLSKTAAILAAEREIELLNRQFFARYVDPARCDDAQLAVVAIDIVAIVRSLLDTGSGGAADLGARLQRTIAGYLAPLLAQAATTR